MGHSVPREIAHGPEGEGHQSNKEKGGESQYSVNHFPLGNEVHKISGDKECLAAGNKKRDTDVDFAISELDVRRANRDQGAEKQRVEDEEIPANMMAEMVGWMCVAHISLNR
jgi:hypothetical protein